MMARAKIVSKVAGKSNHYLVIDDLSASYEVESAVDGYDYKLGEHYRIFVPNGKYDPTKFRLLPYKTSKRWEKVSKLAKDKPASAVALFLYKKNIKTMGKFDQIKTVSSVGANELKFAEGGCAGVDNPNLYQNGDCVAVIHDKRDPLDPDCLLSKNGKPWVAGFGCKQSPRSNCPRIYEYWGNYLTPNAELVASGGEFLFEKTNPRKDEIDSWEVKVSNVYANQQSSPYGIPATVSVGDILRMETLPIEVIGADNTLLNQIWSTYPLPIPVAGNPYNLAIAPKWDITLSPPAIVHRAVSMEQYCSGSDLLMAVNLLTKSEQGFQALSHPNGPINISSQLPAFMILEFDGYMPQAVRNNIRTDAYQGSTGGNLVSFNPIQCLLDKKFKLVYTAPGNEDTSLFRVSLPTNAPDHYALKRPEPRRRSNGSYPPLPFTGFRHFRNSPMDDPENGFLGLGELHYRPFDYSGNDITPSGSHFAGGGGEYGWGLFPGYFEISQQNNVIRNIKSDFLASYPFMANSQLNPGGVLPKLSHVAFYVQGRHYASTTTPTYAYSADPAILQCQKLEFYYQ